MFDLFTKISGLHKFAAAGLIILTGLVPILAQADNEPKRSQRAVAVTFDDLPATHGEYVLMKQVNDKLLASLKAERVPTIGFVVESRLGSDGLTPQRTEILRRWLTDGHDLGNHSFSHIAIDRVAFEQYAADVIRGETVIRRLLAEKGKSLKYYRHTQLRTGPTEEYRRQLSDFLAGRGYSVAPVTIDNNDYIYALAYSKARARGDIKLKQRIADDYIRYMTSVIEHFERLSREFLGYEVKQTLLLHANEINADHFTRLVKMLRLRGYAFVTLDEALKDPAYRLPEVQAKTGLSWLHRWMLAKGLDRRDEPLEPQWIRAAAGL